MKKEAKLYVTAQELSELLGVSLGHSYKLIRQLNKELAKEGYIVIAGKLPARYLDKRYYGCDSDAIAVK